MRWIRGSTDPSKSLRDPPSAFIALARFVRPCDILGLVSPRLLPRSAASPAHYVTPLELRPTPRDLGRSWSPPLVLRAPDPSFPVRAKPQSHAITEAKTRTALLCPCRRPRPRRSDEPPRCVVLSLVPTHPSPRTCSSESVTASAATRTSIRHRLINLPARVGSLQSQVCLAYPPLFPICASNPSRLLVNLASNQWRSAK
jgi:hypothetical protein